MENKHEKSTQHVSCVRVEITVPKTTVTQMIGRGLIYVKKTTQGKGKI